METSGKNQEISQDKKVGTLTHDIQECIPVGFVPTAAVASPRGRPPGGIEPPQRQTLPPPPLEADAPCEQ